MKLINSSWEIIEQQPGLEGIYEQIELAGRTCYKSTRPEGKTAKDFVDFLIKRGHLSPLEHGTVYLMEIWKNTPFDMHLQSKWDNNPYTKIVKVAVGDDIYRYITTNYRVLVENDWLDDLQYLCEPTEYHAKRISIKVNCSIGISREWNRHRALDLTEDMKSINSLEFSVCEQSTRYCNYSKDKFGNELTFIIPSWLEIPEGRYMYEDQNPFLTAGGSIEDYGYDDDPNVWFENGAPFKRARVGTALDKFFKLLHNASEAYFDLLSNHTPQQAREVLPLATATEVVYTGFVDGWKNFFQMRSSILAGNAPHPDIAVLADPLYEEFIKRELI